MPTLYDNFERVKNYVDEQIAASGSEVDLSSYVTKSELSNAGYITAVPSEYVTQTELSSNSYATTTQLSSYLPLSGGTLTGNLTLGNTYFLTVGTQRAWKLFEDGSGSGAYICLQANVNSKSFYIRDVYNNNIIQVYNNNAAGNYVKNYNLNTYTCSIVPNSNNTYTLGSSTAQWAYTYTRNLILNGTDVNTLFPTYTYVANYVSEHSGNSVVVDENLIPKTTTTYTLGDGNHLYASIYTSTIRFGSLDIVGYKNYISANNSSGSEKLQLSTINNSGTSNVLTVSPTGIYTTNNKTLGTSSNKFSYAYINNLILNGTNIISTINGMFSYDTSTGTLTITTI